MNTFDVFNVQNLSSCLMGDPNSRKNPLLLEKIDVGGSEWSVIDIIYLNHMESLVDIFLDWMVQVQKYVWSHQMTCLTKTSITFD